MRKINRAYSRNALISNINQIISDKGMKKCVVAKKAGFTKQGFSDILNNRKILRAEYIPNIADALEVDINTLFGVGR